MTGFDFMVEACKTAYINVFGAEKWHSLTDTEKHDAVMAMCKTLDRAISKI